MDSIHKLPFLLGGFMAVVTGFVSYVCGTASQTIYIRMAVMMVVFFIVGSFIKSTLVSIQDEINKKKEQELLEIRQQEEEEMALKMQAESENSPEVGQRLNLVADDFDDEFSPLTVSRVVAAKSKE